VRTSTNVSQNREEIWPHGGWHSDEDFRTWWERLVLEHPNKNRNTAAKEKALAQIRERKLNRGEFEAGYARLRAAEGERWMQENGRYAPNLWQLLEDEAWKFAPHAAKPVLSAPSYQSTDDYTRRLQTE